MKFSELQEKMGNFEPLKNLYFSKDKYLVCRLDGRKFSKLTESNFEKPFDIRFFNHMRDCLQQLMENSGFEITYGYNQSDEISLLFSKSENNFNRKAEKLLSVIPSFAAGVFSAKFGQPVSFDCRFLEIENKEDVVDYFLFRREDAHRNCFQAYVYWDLVNNKNHSGKKAQNFIKTMSFEDKLAYIEHNYNMNYEQTPDIYKYGLGYFFQPYMKGGVNPITNEAYEALRYELTRYSIKDSDSYRSFLNELIKY